MKLIKKVWLMDGWMDGGWMGVWMGGWMDGIRISHSNQNFETIIVGRERTYNIVHQNKFNLLANASLRLCLWLNIHD